MREEEAWWLAAKCLTMSPQDADEMFFPSTPGKKPTKAKAFCRDCPMLSMCLGEAIAVNLPGFQAGTTESERSHMKKFSAVTELKLRQLNMPPEPSTVSSSPLRLVETFTDDHEWMDEVEPDDNVLKFLDKIEPESPVWDLAI